MSNDERDIRALLEVEAERAPRPQGLRAATIRRGRGRRHGVVALPLLVVTSVAWVAIMSPFSASPDPNIVGPGPEASIGQIVFSRSGEGGGIMTTSAKGGAPKLIAPADFAPMDDPAWSPDGTKVAFRGFYGEARNQAGGLFVMNADGSDRRLIEIDAGGPTWGPNSDELMFTKGGTVYRTSISQRRSPTAVPIRQDVDQVDWSPNGDNLAFTLAGLYVVPADGGEPTIVVGGDSSYPTGPEWSPDGTQIAFTEYIDTPSDEPTQDGAEGANNELGEGVEEPIPMVSILDISTGEIRQVTEGLSPAWSPDGARLAFEKIDGINTSHIYSINVDGTDDRQLTFGDVADHSPDWGPAPSPETREVATFGRYTFSVGGGFGYRRGPMENVGVVEVNSTEGSVCLDSHLPGATAALLRREGDDPWRFITIFDIPTRYRPSMCARGLDQPSLQAVIDQPTAYVIEIINKFTDESVTVPLEIMGEPDEERSEAPNCVGDEICLSRRSGPAGVDVTASMPASARAENGVDEIPTDKVEWWWGLEDDEWIDVVEGNPPAGASLLAVARDPRDDQLITSFIVPFGQDPGTYPIFAISYNDGGHGPAGWEIAFELTDGYGCPTLLPPGPNAEYDAGPLIDNYLESRQPEETSGFNYRLERLEQPILGKPEGDCSDQTWQRSYQVEGNFVWKQGERPSASLSYFRFVVGRAEGDWVVWAVAH